MTKKLIDWITDWDDELPASILINQQKLENRRAFLMRIGVLTATAAFLPGVTLAKTVKSTATESTFNSLAFLKQQPWKTFAAVQQHLFPATKDSPGASDINATLYLKNTLDTPDMTQSDRKFILNGVNWLNNISKKQKDTAFIELQQQDKELVLRQITKSRAGENWLSTLLLYIFEALLTAPAYGGNPDAIGWKWLQHQPGFPLPASDKLYYKL